MNETDVDVIVVGQGIVGQLVSLYLAQRGHRVLAIERHTESYSLPRAVHYDPDVNRLLSGLGLGAAEQATFSEPALSYDWLNADREVLLTFPAPLEGSQGWPDSTMFTQPELEAALWSRQVQAAALTLRWGVKLTAFNQDDGGVTATLAGAGGTETVRARFLIGCDGANSTVRDLAGLEVEDLGFDSDWLVVDLRMPAREWVPVNGQICDPARPTSCVSGGPGRRRFEFMLMPGEDAAEFSTPENAWRLLAPWRIDPTVAKIERLTMYSFHAQCAMNWRVGRVFIAGDAAHQMPPFFGRGMVSGARDALNLAWKLDYVLSSAAPIGLLDSYESERFAHVQFALGMSIELGRIICQTDPAAVAARDAHFLEKGPLPWNAMPPMPPEILGPGFFPSGNPGGDPVAGRIGEQHPMRDPDDRVGLLDEVTFGEFLILADMRRLTVDDAVSLRAAIPPHIPGKLIEVVPEGAPHPNQHSGVDVTGRYAALFDVVDRAVIVYRPDFHGFGSASTVADAVRLVASLDPFIYQEAP